MCCKGKRKRDDAVSELVGEMLMLTIVLIMMAVFASSASDVLPPARDPSVTILQVQPGSQVELYHKGGDAIPMSELRITVDGKERGYDLYLYGASTPTADSDSLFDIGGRISIDISSFTKGDRIPIRLATSRAVIYSVEVTP